LTSAANPSRADAVGRALDYGSSLDPASSTFDAARRSLAGLQLAQQLAAEGSASSAIPSILLQQDFADLEMEANLEQRQRDLMVQANAKVAAGTELLTEARSRVLEGYSDALHERLLNRLRRIKGNAKAAE
jgi:hypothetical protein